MVRFVKTAIYVTMKERHPMDIARLLSYLQKVKIQQLFYQIIFSSVIQLELELQSTLLNKMIT